MAELERRSPERAKLRAADLGGLADAWAMVEDLWGSTVARAQTLPEPVLTSEELGRVCAPPDSPGHPNRDHTVRACLHVILNEEWEHNGYARRGLDVLDSR